MLRVHKRDGSYAPYDPNKIRRAMLLAFNEVMPGQIPDVQPLVDQVEAILEDTRTGTPHGVEFIQDKVEYVLMQSYPEVAKRYILYRNERAKLRAERKAPDSSALSDYITASKYARYVPALGRREVYSEIVDRVESMYLRRWPELSYLIQPAFDMVRAKKILPSMRSMQFGGLAIEANNCRMYNCAWTLADRLRFFGETLWCLLSGTGVGFSVQFQHVNKLPALKRIDKRRVKHHSIDDSIEGWGDAVNELVRGYFVTGEYVEFDYSRIRHEGADLVTSGGKAPGHLPLRECLENLRSLFSKAQGRKLRPIEVFDAVCFLAEAVLAGGIRRSSLICIFSLDDSEMMYAKAHGNYVPEGIPGKVPVNPHRAMANISAFCHRQHTTREQFERLMLINREWGEPGFYWGWDYDFGTNPCGEIGMLSLLVRGWEGEDRSLDYDWSFSGNNAFSDEDAIAEYGNSSGWQFCNVCDINGATILNTRDFLDRAQHAAVIGTMQAAFTNFSYLGPVTERIVRREALIGVGLTGIMDNPSICLDPKTLRQAAEHVVECNRKIAKLLGINPAARCTTVKPGGTAPLVLGCVASGSTPHHAPRYFRTVTANPLEPVAQHFRKMNPHMVEVKPNGDWALTFCVDAPDNAITLEDLSPIDHMEHIYTLYENWIKPGTARTDVVGSVVLYEASDMAQPIGRIQTDQDLKQAGLPEGMFTSALTHNVSCTIVVGSDEWDSVINNAWENRHRITAMAFLPRFADDVYPYAPRKAVRTALDEARWNHLISMYQPIDWKKFNEEGDNTEHVREAACGGGACEI